MVTIIYIEWKSSLSRIIFLSNIGGDEGDSNSDGGESDPLDDNGLDSNDGNGSESNENDGDNNDDDGNYNIKGGVY